MTWLLELLQRLRPRIENGPLAALTPVFNAAEHFFFSPDTRTSGPPHVRDPLDAKRFMATALIALMPPFLAGLYFFGWRLVAMIVVSYVVGGTVEVLFAVVRKEEINEGFLVTGFIFPLILPPALPLWIVGVGVAFGVVVGKELFGGTGRNLFNPALVGRCFLAMSYPAVLAANWIVPGPGVLGHLTHYIAAGVPDALTSATPLVLAKQGTLVSVWDLFIGRVAGSAGETSALAILLGGVFLLATRVASWRTVAGILASFAVLTGVLHWAHPLEIAPVTWHLFAGGLLFGAFFMATDPITGPASNAGKWAYGILIGIVTVLIRNFTGYVEGVMFAILLGNICAPLLDLIAVKARLRRLASVR